MQKEPEYIVMKRKKKESNLTKENYLQTDLHGSLGHFMVPLKHLLWKKECSTALQNFKHIKY